MPFSSAAGWSLPAGKPLFPVKGRKRKAMLRADLRAAGIEPVVDGKVIDLHALRTTFITHLPLGGVPLAVAQKLARHSDPRLTSNVYTSLGLAELQQGGPGPAADRGRPRRDEGRRLTSACHLLVVRLSRAGLGVAAHGGFCLDSALRHGGPEGREKAVFSRVLQAVQWFHRPWECLHLWWGPWSSKQVAALNALLLPTASSTPLQTQLVYNWHFRMKTLTSGR